MLLIYSKLKKYRSDEIFNETSSQVANMNTAIIYIIVNRLAWIGIKLKQICNGDKVG
ncbi:MAG: hypothetical protein NDF53_01515 [archaeon GB-1867-097]|nr:hypothetical protein [Candidatus Culexmicrobium thermophilum]MCS7384396.1 hypothetical protein [Candidatus Culexmicrobium thermophilum]